MDMQITEPAVARIKALREKQGKPALLLRVTVLGGGCAGFQYDFDFVDKKGDEDVLFGETVITDPSSLPFLDGAIIDFEQNLMGAAFKIKNPNAASGCGCGKSFSTVM